MRWHRGTVALLVCAGAVVVGCAPPPEPSEPSVQTSASSAQQPAAEIDLSRLNEIRGDFPPGFEPEGLSVPKRQTAQQAALVGNTVAYGRPFTVEPPHCRAMLEPVRGQVGANKIGVGAEGPDRQVITVSVTDPVTVPAGLPSTGCERVAFHVRSDVRTVGTATPLTAPGIDGAATSAIKVAIDGIDYVEYFYIAILDGRVFAQVRARVNPEFPAEPLLSGLLTKAVAAVRGG
ncbi:MAG: DUF5642 family protein [Actinomycetota bacterium]|nr:DUF5642 family protein [Actinomycetota bacterium]